MPGLRHVLVQGEAAPGGGLADAPIGGRKVRVFWPKRRLRCSEEFCVTKTFTHQPSRRPQHVAVRGRLTERLRALVAKAARCRSVAEVAAEHGLGWRTVWRAVQAATETVLSASKPSTLRRLGIDQTSFRRPGRFATGFVDLDTGRLTPGPQGRRAVRTTPDTSALAPPPR